MSVRRLAPADLQPASFAFTHENARWAEGQIAKYPEGRQASAVIPLLWQAQQQHGGWLPKPAVEAVAADLGMPIIRVMEVATFYTMFNLEPVGRFFVQLCGTVPCHVMGALDLKQVLLDRIGDQSHVTADGMFSWLEVECLGACCNAPMVQINDDYYEDLTPDLLVKLLDDLAAGRAVKAGPQNGRRASEPADDVKTLLDEALYDGSLLGAWRKRLEEQPVKAPADGAADASGPNDPKPAKPDAGRAEHKPAADAPAQRARNGEPPVPPDERAGASDTAKATMSQGGDAEPAPARDGPPPATGGVRPLGRVGVGSGPGGCRGRGRQARTRRGAGGWPSRRPETHLRDRSEARGAAQRPRCLPCRADRLLERRQSSLDRSAFGELQRARGARALDRSGQNTRGWRHGGRGRGGGPWTKRRLTHGARRSRPDLHESLRVPLAGSRGCAPARGLGRDQVPARPGHRLDHQRDEGLGPARPRRRRFPDRPQMVFHAEGGRRAAALPRGQCRRIGARHLQGPGDHAARSAPPDRGLHDRVLRDAGARLLHIHPGRVYRGARRAAARGRRGL